MPRHVSLVLDEVVLTSRSAKHGRIRCNVRSLFLIEWNCSFTELAFALNSCHFGTSTLEIAEVSFCDLRFTTNFSHFSDGARQPHSDYEVITNSVIWRYTTYFSHFSDGARQPHSDYRVITNSVIWRYTTYFSHFSDGARQPHSDYRVITNSVIWRYTTNLSIIFERGGTASCYWCYQCNFSLVREEKQTCEILGFLTRRPRIWLHYVMFTFTFRFRLYW